DLVIRLHDCEWQDRADYGERYDWGVLNRRFPAVLDRIVRRPAMGWLVYHLGGGFAVTPPEPHRIFDLMRWRQRMGVVPTRGLAAVMMAAQAFRPDEIRLYGLDAVVSGDGADYRYAPAMGRGPGTAGVHDMAA